MVRLLFYVGLLQRLFDQLQSPSDGELLFYLSGSEKERSVFKYAITRDYSTPDHQTVKSRTLRTTMKSLQTLETTMIPQKTLVQL
uniref:Uncharacterized protein n=1 Tax=Knipowitschia caucasica TaxID=637954 RepID=A0AAV2M4K7_KNICA